MNIVPIIADGSIVKSHTEYPITNKQWKLMDNGLGHASPPLDRGPSRRLHHSPVGSGVYVRVQGGDW